MRFRLGFPASTVWVLVAALAVLGGVAVQRWRPPTVLLEDTVAIGNYFLRQQRARPNRVLRVPLGSGYVTYLEATLVMAGGAICLFAASLPAGAGEGRLPRGLFFHAGVLSLLLGADDLFMLHEALEARWARAGSVTTAVYAALLAWICLRYRRALLARRLGPLLLALAFLALAHWLDSHHPDPELVRRLSPKRWDRHQLPALLEEGFKWLGLVMWTAFFVRLARRDLLERREATASPPDGRDADSSRARGR